MRNFPRKPRVLVVGGGTIARALEKSFSSKGIPTFRTGRNPSPWHLDLSRDPDCWKVPLNLDWVFVCAGITSREACERDSWRSRWVNVVGGIRVARYFQCKGTRVVFFGTDLDASEGEYARQKEELRQVVAAMPHCVWIRLGKVIHSELPVFVQWQKDLDQRRPLRILKGVSISPLNLETVAENAWQLIRQGPPHSREANWCSAWAITYKDLAKYWKIQESRRSGKNSKKTRNLSKPD